MLLVLNLTLSLPACELLHRKKVVVEPQVRVDTVTITKEVAPALPQGTPAQVCLSTGQTIEITITPKGDTLVGATRIRLLDIPGIVLAGTYAGEASWFRNNDAIQFEKRTYRKSGVPISPKCNDLKIVGDYNGTVVLADILAPAPLERIYIPIRPSSFQPYTTTVPKPRRR